MNIRQYFEPAFSLFIVVIFLSLFNNYLQSSRTITLAQTEDIQQETTAINTPSPTIPLTKQQASTITPTKKPAPRKTQIPVKTCIVTINGKKYNVQRLRTTHSGGDIFVCNTNMTATFNSQHGGDYKILSPYLL